MELYINYAVGCNPGKAREKNQDNFWFQSHYLKWDNKGLNSVLTGEYPARELPSLCVFDGLGGEQLGEVASFIAAETYDEYYREHYGEPSEQFLLQSCKYMNKKVCEYSKDKTSGFVGTTASLTLFDSEYANICNVGDSPVFLHNGTNITKLSVDHVANVPQGVKAPLLQSIGLPPEKRLLKPAFTRVPLRAGDKYLLCSDGLTDMVSTSIIEHIITLEYPLQTKVQRLIDIALANGGLDNITIILCEVVYK